MSYSASRSRSRWAPTCPNAPRDSALGESVRKLAIHTDMASKSYDKQTVTSFDIAHLAVAAKSDHERLAQQVCHPEPFGYAQDKLREGSRGQILRCAQNDTSERLRRKVYQCRAFRFSAVAESLSSVQGSARQSCSEEALFCFQVLHQGFSCQPEEQGGAEVHSYSCVEQRIADRVWRADPVVDNADQLRACS